MIWNNKTFQPLNFINGKTYPYGSKGILRNYQYRSDPKLGPVIVEIRRIPCNCHACTTIFSLSWDSKIKEAVDQPRYYRVYTCKYSEILGCHNNWIIMNFVDDGTLDNNSIFEGKYSLSLESLILYLPNKKVPSIFRIIIT